MKTLFPSNLFETYAYDNNSNLTSRTDRNGMGAKTLFYGAQNHGVAGG